MTRMIASLAVRSLPVVAPLELGPRRAVVQLRGPLGIDWAARLSSQLAVRGVAIHSLGARRGATAWFAEIDMTSDVTALDELDVLALLDQPLPVEVPRSLVLTHVHVERRLEHGGCLLLTVEGTDRVGFLAALLHTLAFQSLFPVEIRARTFGRSVVDCFWLKGLGYEPPAETAVRRIEGALARLRRSAEAK